MTDMFQAFLVDVRNEVTHKPLSLCCFYRIHNVAVQRLWLFQLPLLLGRVTVELFVLHRDTLAV